MEIQLMERVLVDSAPRRVREWGPYQFPYICKGNGRYYYHFADAPDNYASYGHPGWVYQSDPSCLDWQICQDEDAYMEARALCLSNGDLIVKHNVNSVRTDMINLPECVGDFVINDRHYFAYRNEELPVDIGGLSIKRKIAGTNEWVIEHAPMHEKGGIRCAFNGVLPAMQARCNKMCIGPDGKVYIMVYNFKLREDGTPDSRDCVYLMRSDDNAHSFYEIGAIPYVPDLDDDPRGYSPKRRGWLEPDMCFLDDKRILCVLRTTHQEIGPLYQCISVDGGATWTKPHVIHDHGVYPSLLKLECGALVLAIGRPGVQIMISWDDGNNWSAPKCIVPQRHADYCADSCGYTYLVPVDKHTCMLGFSDFQYDPGDGYPRKALFSQLIRIQS